MQSWQQDTDNEHQDKSFTIGHVAQSQAYMRRVFATMRASGFFLSRHVLQIRIVATAWLISIGSCCSVASDPCVSHSLKREHS